MSNNSENLPFAFTKFNYLLMGSGLVLILLGLILLSGGGSADPNVFSEAIFDSRRMTEAPLIMLAGFVLEVFAIMYKPKKQ
jgi:hypothetical protein